jgi:transcriptional regulator with XRE-family HTH domain
MSHIGVRMKEIRKRRNMTQESLAKGICTRAYITMIEKGYVTPSSALLEKLAERLQVTVEELQNPHDLLTEVIQDNLFQLVELIEEKQFEDAKPLFEKLHNIPLSEANQQALILWAKGKLAEYEMNYKNAESYYTEALNFVANANDAITKVRILDSLGTHYCRFQNDPQKGSIFLNEAFELVRKHDLTGRVKINVLISVANMSFRLAEFLSGIRYFKEVRDLQEAYHTQYRLEDVYMGLGLGYSITTHYDEAHFYITEAIKIFEVKQCDEILLYSCIGNLGILYRDMGKYLLSEDYLKRAIDGFKKIKFEYGIYNNLNELALTYKVAGKSDEAKNVLSQVIHCDNELTACEAKFIFSGILLEEDKLEEALELALAAVDVMKLSMNKQLLETALHIGDLLTQRKQFEKASLLFAGIARRFLR